MRVEISKGFPSRSNHRRLGSFFSLLFLLLSTSDSLGQSTVLRVVDGKSKEPLPYSTVQLEGYAVGYICDKDGFALIEMPEEIEDLRHLKLSHVGYASKIVHIDILTIISGRFPSMEAPMATPGLSALSPESRISDGLGTSCSPVICIE